MDKNEKEDTKELDPIMEGMVVALEEKYNTIIEAIAKHSKEESTFQIASVLRNSMIMQISPLSNNPEILEVLMDLLGIDLYHLGYSLNKLETK